MARAPRKIKMESPALIKVPILTFPVMLSKLKLNLQLPYSNATNKKGRSSTLKMIQSGKFTMPLAIKMEAVMCSAPRTMKNRKDMAAVFSSVLCIELSLAKNDVKVTY